MSPFFLQATVRISDYSGSSDLTFLYIISYILIFILSNVLLLALAWFIYKKLKIFTTLKQAKLSKKEYNFLNHLCSRLHVTSFFPIICHRYFFGTFLDQASHIYNSSNLSIEHIRAEAYILSSIREKFAFPMNFDSTIIDSSRSLPKKAFVSISFYDPDTNKLHRFKSTIIENIEFFIAIEPSLNKEIEEAFSSPDKHKIKLMITCAKKRDATYLFYSKFIKTISFPTKMWLITHSQYLQRTPLTAPLSIKATSLNSQEQYKGIDISITIYAIDNENCLFITDNPEQKLEVGSLNLLRFDLMYKEWTARCHIEKILNHDNKTIYKGFFTSLDMELSKTIISFNLSKIEHKLSTKKQNKVK